MLVSVIVPAHNAQSTIGATLSSVSRQTYRDLEIIVIADGCTDQTVCLVKEHAAGDLRIRIVEQDNTGVSGARQRGLLESTGEFLATMDADDIWHPTKIEKQVLALRGQSAQVAAVYCWSRRIDEQNRVIASQPAVRAEGFILCRHVYDNVAGNGSCLMVRRSAALRVGGFVDERRKSTGQSADDHFFQLKLAKDFLYVVVPEYLVGYRVLTNSISVNKEKMHRSIMLNLEAVRSMTQHVPAWVYRWSRAASLYDTMGFNLRQRRYLRVLQTGILSVILDPIMCADRIWNLGTKILHGALDQNNGKNLDYFDVDPCQNVIEHSALHQRRMKKLAKIDRSASPSSATKSFRQVFS